LKKADSLALAPGETSESFIREVDENLRRSQAEEFFRRFGIWLIVGAVLLLIAIGAFLYWRNHRAEVAANQSQKLAAVIGDIGAGKTGSVDQRLAEIQREGTDEYAGLAQMTGAAFALQRGDRPKAISTYKAVAADDGQPQAVRDTALLRGTALEFDSLKPEEVIARLQPLAQPDSPWFGAAGEMTAVAMLKQNRKTEAGRLFAAIAAKKDLPPSVRSRAVQIAGTLGVDATAQLPASR
jgi:hypothetical protein